MTTPNTSRRSFLVGTSAALAAAVLAGGQVPAHSVSKPAKGAGSTAALEQWLVNTGQGRDKS